jgi:hypothetical protein
VFRRLAGPVAPAGLDGAFWRGMRVAAVDGFLLDVPDTPANRAEFGGPSDAKGRPAGFPQARVVTLTETGTHSSVDASVGGFRTGEPELAIAMAPSAAGMLVIMDRGFPGVALWKAYTQARAHLLIRARSSVAARPVEVLDDGTYPRAAIASAASAPSCRPARPAPRSMHKPDVKAVPLNDRVDGKDGLVALRRRDVVPAGEGEACDWRQRLRGLTRRVQRRALPG